MAFSSRLATIKAASLSREFRVRVAGVHYSSVHWFIKCHGLVHQMDTRISQWYPSELEAISAAFMTTVRPMVVGARRDQDFIINMDSHLLQLLSTVRVFYNC